MTRTHRLLHRALWPVLAVIVALGFVMALSLRPPPPSDAHPPQAEQSR